MNITKATRNFLIFALGWIAAIACIPGGEGTAEPPEPALFNGARALERIDQQLQLGDRSPGSDGHRAVATWIREELIAVGWESQFQPFRAFETDLQNVIAIHNPEGRPYILFGAHYDTRPLADKDVASPSQPVPGANDGASGVAVLLELASAVVDNAGDCRIDLIFFDAEDSGGLDGWDWILGSSYFVAHLSRDPDAVVIVDMIGDRDLEIYYERSSDDALRAEIWGVANALGFTAFIAEDKYAMHDDHVPFIRRGIPTALLIDFDYPYWHTTEDTLDKVSAESLAQVGLTLEAWTQLRCHGDLAED